MTNPGTTTTTTTTTTPPTPGKVLTTGQIQTVNDYIASIDADIPSNVDKAALTELVTDIGKSIPTDAKVGENMDDLLLNNYPGAKGSTQFNGMSSYSDPNYFYNNANLYDKKPAAGSLGAKGYFEYTPTQKAADFYNFVRLTKLGMTEKQAYDIMAKAGSEERMKAAYSAFTGKDYSG